MIIFETEHAAHHLEAQLKKKNTKYKIVTALGLINQCPSKEVINLEQSYLIYLDHT